MLAWFVGLAFLGECLLIVGLYLGIEVYRHEQSFAQLGMVGLRLLERFYLAIRAGLILWKSGAR